MRPNARLTLSEHIARQVLEGLRAGHWMGKVPGVRALAAELRVSRDTARDALRLLEEQGILSHSGAGRSRLVSAPGNAVVRKILRVGIFIPNPLEHDNRHSNELILTTRQTIENLGHVCFIASRTARHLKGKARRIRQSMEEADADAWIVYSGRRDILESVAAAPFPAFALGGDSMGLPLASSRADLRAGIHDCVDTLVGYGHRRIVLISPEKWRVPVLNSSATIFLERLKHHGIPAETTYNLPDWESTPQGLDALLRSLFFATPPTAFLVVEPECVGPVLVFLASRGLSVPDGASVINILPDPMQAFYVPKIAHFQWPVIPHVKRIARWASALAQGKVDKKAFTIEPSFVPTESIGPAPVR